MFGNPSRNMLTLLFLEHSAESLYLQLGSKCRELKDIHFGQCYKISDEGMIVIAKGCLKLRRIYMQENKFSTDIIPYYCLPRYLVPPGSFRISHALLQSAPAERITYLGTQVLLDKQPIMHREIGRASCRERV